MSTFQFDIDSWLVEIMNFADQSAPNCIRMFGSSLHPNNAKFIGRLLAESEDVLERGDSFLAKSTIKYTSGDIDAARIQYQQFLKFSVLDNPTEETVENLLQLPLSLRKILTYYEDIIAIHDEMKKMENTPKKSAFAESFKRAHGKIFGLTELNYLGESAERSRIILAGGTDFVNRLEQVINPANYTLKSTSPSRIDARP